MPEPEKLPPGSPCTNCGKCCTNPWFMQTLTATAEDIARWRREKRHDILQFADIFGADAFADLWVDDKDRDRARCPFVRKVRNEPRYLCTIYETRPQACRDYVPWAPNSICEVVPVPDKPHTTK